MEVFSPGAAADLEIKPGIAIRYAWAELRRPRVHLPIPRLVFTEIPQVSRCHYCQQTHKGSEMGGVSVPQPGPSPQAGGLARHHRCPLLHAAATSGWGVSVPLPPPWALLLLYQLTFFHSDVEGVRGVVLPPNAARAEIAAAVPDCDIGNGHVDAVIPVLEGYAVPVVGHL